MNKVLFLVFACAALSQALTCEVATSQQECTTLSADDVGCCTWCGTSEDEGSCVTSSWFVDASSDSCPTSPFDLAAQDCSASDTHAACACSGVSGPAHDPVVETCCCRMNPRDFSDSRCFPEVSRAYCEGPDNQSSCYFELCLCRTFTGDLADRISQQACEDGGGRCLAESTTGAPTTPAPSPAPTELVITTAYRPSVDPEERCCCLLYPNRDGDDRCLPGVKVTTCIAQDLRTGLASRCTTQAPTTASPTTAQPTSAPTAPPSSAAPTTTSAPTVLVTAEPTTAEPTTAGPTTAEPTTAEPTTEAPTTAAPTTEAPTTDAPTTDAPTAAPLPFEIAITFASDLLGIQRVIALGNLESRLGVTPTEVTGGADNTLTFLVPASVSQTTLQAVLLEVRNSNRLVAGLPLVTSIGVVSAAPTTVAPTAGTEAPTSSAPTYAPITRAPTSVVSTGDVTIKFGRDLTGPERQAALDELAVRFNTTIMEVPGANANEVTIMIPDGTLPADAQAILEAAASGGLGPSLPPVQSITAATTGAPTRAPTSSVPTMAPTPSPTEAPTMPPTFPPTIAPQSGGATVGEVITDQAQTQFQCLMGLISNPDFLPPSEFTAVAGLLTAPVTFMAPTCTAIDALTASGGLDTSTHSVVNILKYHLSAPLANISELRAFNDQARATLYSPHTVRFTEYVGSPRVNCAPVQQIISTVDGGFVVPVDQLLTPTPTVADVLTAKAADAFADDAGLSLSVEAVTLAGVQLTGETFTAFLPTNGAWRRAYPQITATNFAQVFADKQLQFVVGNHLVPGKTYCAASMPTHTLVTTGSIKTQVVDGVVSLFAAGSNSANMISEVVIQEGVIHVIDEVLRLPEPTTRAPTVAHGDHDLLFVIGSRTDLSNYRALLDMVPMGARLIQESDGIAVYAPNNAALDAFDLQSVASLDRFVRYQIFPPPAQDANATQSNTPRVDSFSAPNFNDVETVNGFTAEFYPGIGSNGDLWVTEGVAVQPDVANAVEYAAARADLSYAAGLLLALESRAPELYARFVADEQTILLPNDQAFLDLDSEIRATANSRLEVVVSDAAALEALLTQHILTQVVWSAALKNTGMGANATRVPSVNSADEFGPAFVITNGTVGIRVDGSESREINVVTADMLMGVGQAVHVVDRVLLPPGFVIPTLPPTESPTSASSSIAPMVMLLVLLLTAVLM